MEYNNYSINDNNLVMPVSKATGQKSTINSKRINTECKIYLLYSDKHQNPGQKLHIKKQKSK